MAARPHHFLLLAALLLLIGASSSGAAGDVVAAGNGKVTVELYYESLCPPSALFVVDLLAEALEGLLEAADVTLVPYGNAKVRKDGTITCEHGPEERLLNTVEACVIQFASHHRLSLLTASRLAWPDMILIASCCWLQNVHFGFINCVEGLVMNETQGEWESCFQKLGLYPKAVTECYKSEHGHKLSLKYGKQTGALVPPLTGVPWVVVDGKQRDDGEFVSYVCKAYKGRPPKICQEPDRHYPTVQQEQVVEPGNTVTYSSGDFKLDDGVEDEIEVPRADDN